MSGEKQKLDEIKSYPFFKDVGKCESDAVVPVKSWNEAFLYFSSTVWENCRLMASNATLRMLEERAWARAEEWNARVRKIRPEVTNFIEQRLLPKLQISGKILDETRANLQWDLMFIALEYEFRDVVEPIFHLKYLDPWYARGHFPCGWSGDEFPEHWDGIVKSGKLVVF
jgi:hypothetical protein